MTKSKPWIHYYTPFWASLPHHFSSSCNTTKINVYDASFNVAFKTMSSFNYLLMFNDIEFKVSLSCVIITLL